VKKATQQARRPFVVAPIASGLLVRAQRVEVAYAARWRALRPAVQLEPESPMKSLSPLLLAMLATVWLACAPAAHAHPVGWGSGPPLVTEHGFDPNIAPVHPNAQPGGWTIGAPTDPIGITAAPGQPPWLKLLQVPNFFQFSTHLTLIEHLVVGQPGDPGPPWTDWHEHIIDSPWDWVSGQIIVAGVVVATGELGDPNPGPPDGHSSNIWFDFDPLQPGTQLTVVKTIHCHVQPGCEQAPIRIIEYPTIPEPATLGLLGAALLATIGLRSRRKVRAV
jgi:PEP-CTERM motif